ncbi:MAG: hypothetical protein LBR33_09100 [Propionibacteriaceae bacterium]|jgi:hypothetical protein|nr:hypothetical protein [Propionibacteriaceae bacterium]
MVALRPGGPRYGAHIKPSFWVCVTPLGVLSLALYGFALNDFVLTLQSVFRKPKQALLTLAAVEGEPETWREFAQAYAQQLTAAAVLAMLVFGIVFVAQRRALVQGDVIVFRSLFGRERYRPLAGVTSVTGLYLNPILPGGVWIHYAGRRLPVWFSGLGMSNKALRRLVADIRAGAALSTPVLLAVPASA